MKKIVLLIVSFLRPLHRWLTQRYPQYFARLRAELKDPYLSGMVVQFNRWHEWIFQPSFEKVQLDATELANLKKLSADGTLVYIMKNRGQLEYSFFNHRFLREGIPLAQFANGCRTLFWRPVDEMIEKIIARWDYYHERGFLEDPIQSRYLENRLIAGDSVLLNLRVSHELLLGTEAGAISFIPALLAAARQSKKPIYLMTQQFLYDRHPDKEGKSWVDTLFGPKANPGLLRKFILFLRSYRKRATVKFGQPLVLQDFVQAHANLDAREISLKLQNELLVRLMIERKSITGPVLQSRERILDKLLRHSDFKEKLALLATQTGRQREELEQRARKLFKTIAADINYNYLDVYDHMVHWLTKNIYDGVDIDTAGFTRIKAYAGKYPIILVPSHRSHIDYLLISYLFYNHDLTMPHICAGENLSFWPVGGLVRKAGGFFIRRSLGDDTLYRLVLETYLRILVKEGYCVEFFIEGTRSRTGKLLKPKMGILAMLMEAYQAEGLEDMYFVPISINYEQILEQKSYVDEMDGGKKEKENVTGLIKARGKFRRKYGKVFIRFGEPQGIKNFLQEKNNLLNRRAVEEFAYRLTYQINKVAVVTPTAMVAMALLISPEKGVSEVLLLGRIKYLENYLHYKGCQFSALITQKGEWAYQEAIKRLSASGLIKSYRDFSEKFFTLDDDRRLSLDYHKNTSLHFFVSLVCFSKVLATAQNDELSFAEVKQRFETVKYLLHHDFTFSERASLEEHLTKVMNFYRSANVIAFDESTRIVSFKNLREDPAFQCYASLLNNFLESSYVTLMYLKHKNFKDLPLKKLIFEIRASGQLFYHKGTLRHPEALSQFNIRSALSCCQDLGLLKLEKDFCRRLLDVETLNRWLAILNDLLGMTKNQADWGGPKELAKIIQPEVESATPLEVH